MDISESVLFSTLAQFNKKEFQDANTKFKSDQKAFEVIKSEPPKHKVNLQYELERKIIEILLLYGEKSADFEDLVLKEDEKTGALKLEPVINNAKVFEKIYLDLQEDEMQFSDPKFKSLYYTLIDTLHQETEFSTRDFMSKLDQDMASEVTTILMEDERYMLDDWERKQIIPKEKTESIAQLVSQTILSLRCFLIDKKVAEYQQETLTEKPNSKVILEDVKDYLGLKMLLSRKLGKVVGTKI